MDGNFNDNDHKRKEFKIVGGDRSRIKTLDFRKPDFSKLAVT